MIAGYEFRIVQMLAGKIAPVLSGFGDLGDVIKTWPACKTGGGDIWVEVRPADKAEPNPWATLDHPLLTERLSYMTRRSLGVRG